MQKITEAEIIETFLKNVPPKSALNKFPKIKSQILG